MILQAIEHADEKGAVAYLTKQAVANPRDFMNLLTKIIPQQIDSTVDSKLTVQIKR